MIIYWARNAAGVLMPRKAATGRNVIMPKGGARVNSGPAPDPNALRRERPSDKDGWLSLPASGRDGDAPEWPLPEPMSVELETWARIWATPQAVAWERLGWTSDVALYCRYLVLGAAGDVKAAGEARQWSDRLGLNPSAMARNRWRIVDDESAPLASVTEMPARKSARDRFKARDGGT